MNVPSKNRYSNLPWRADFYQDSPMYTPVRDFAEYFAAFRQWPTLGDYEALLQSQATPPLTQTGAALSIVAQDERPNTFHEHYAPRIYMTGELQTREHNWHDFFQFLTWLAYPRAKAVINALHIEPARGRIADAELRGRRSPLENALSLFDEGGAVLLSSDATLLKLVREFSWQELFWQRRTQLAGQFECLVFGHALFEKGLAPYIGMTANTILIHVDNSYFQQDLGRRRATCDALLADYIGGGRLSRPAELHPFPILGLPGWYDGNNNATFYENREYFRPGRGGRRELYKN